MRLLELHLKAFGPFTDHVVSLGDDRRRLVLVYGPNEAGKSSALRAITALRYGFPNRSADTFVHDYASLRVGGVFVDAEGQRHSLMRRKGRGVTLKAVDFERGGVELPDPVAGAVQALLTAGLQESDHDSMFGLDHTRLREGGQALERGDGELGAALFEASSGAVDVRAILARLNDKSREIFNPAAQSRTPRFNAALADYRRESERHRNASVRATRWEQLQREWVDAKAALDARSAARHALLERRTVVKELIAVSPTLAELCRCEAGLAGLADVPLLDENAAAERSAAVAGLAESQADAQTWTAAQDDAQARRDGQAVDAAVLGVAEAITTLRASAQVIDGHLAQEAAARADIAAHTLALAAAAREIDPGLAPRELVLRNPSLAARTRLIECLDGLARAQQALEMQLEANTPDLAPQMAQQPVPDAVAVSALRRALEQTTRQAQALERLPTLQRLLQQQQREADTARASLGLADEQAARAVVPMLGAAIDQAVDGLAAISAARKSASARDRTLAQALAVQKETIAGLTEHGDVPTMVDVQRARAQRSADWARVRATYIDGPPAERDLFTPAPPVAEAFEAAVARADGVVDGIVGDHERASRLSAARRKVAELELEQQGHRQEAAALDEEEARLRRAWADTLVRAAIPAMAPALLRDWLAGHAACLARIQALSAGAAERDDALHMQAGLRVLLQGAINRLGLAQVGEGESLDTLQAIALDGLREVAERTTARDQAAGQKQQREVQRQQREARAQALAEAAVSARAALDAQSAVVGVAAGESAGVYRARLLEFDALQKAAQAQSDAQRALAAATRSLQHYAAIAEAVASALGEPVAHHVNVVAGRWMQRLDAARQAMSARDAAVADLQAATRQLAECHARALRHRAALDSLCLAAGVDQPGKLPEAEAASQRRRALLAAAETARKLLAGASRRSREALEALRAGLDAPALLAEEARLDSELADAEAQLSSAQAAEEQARHALAAVDASDEAAEAADAMERAAACMRTSLELQMRLRLAHGLLHEAMRRFKQRTQAPMLGLASGYFAQITGGAFSGIASDDSDVRPVIVAQRADGRTVHVAGMSEGTRDQLYLALRLAALDLQRERGVELPLVLDDVLMTSDDERAACMLRGLASFSRRGQVIVFTHHLHLCEVAVRAVAEDQLLVVSLGGER